MAIAESYGDTEKNGERLKRIYDSGRVWKPKSSLEAHKETPISCSRRTGKAEDQNQHWKISSSKREP